MTKLVTRILLYGLLLVQGSLGICGPGHHALDGVACADESGPSAADPSSPTIRHVSHCPACTLLGQGVVPAERFPLLLIDSLPLTAAPISPCPVEPPGIPAVSRAPPAASRAATPFV